MIETSERLNSHKLLFYFFHSNGQASIISFFPTPHKKNEDATESVAALSNDMWRASDRQARE
jgi:hypothetical protein